MYQHFKTHNKSCRFFSKLYGTVNLFPQSWISNLNLLEKYISHTSHLQIKIEFRSSFFDSSRFVFSRGGISLEPRKSIWQSRMHLCKKALSFSLVLRGNGDLQIRVSIACVASVSNRIIARKVERKQKKG